MFHLPRVLNELVAGQAVDEIRDGTPSLARNAYMRRMA
jgi:hypothetical protein